MSTATALIEKAIENAGILVNNYQTIDSLRSALASGDHAFVGVPAFIEELFEDDAWRDCLDHQGARHTFDDDGFSDFVTSPPPRGLGATLEEVRRYLGDSENPLRVSFEKRVTRSAGGNNNPYGRGGKPSPPINPNDIRFDSSESDSPPDPPPKPKRDRSGEPQAGTSVGYAVRRLGRERPDLLAKVEQGELSAHSAMREAGFVRRTVAIPIEPVAAVRLIVKHFKPDDLYELIRGLVNWSGIDPQEGR